MPKKNALPSQHILAVKGIPKDLRASFAVACRARGHKQNFVIQSLMEAFVSAVAEDKSRPLKISIS